MKNEFDIIEKYFNKQKKLAKHHDIIKSIGDDCAVLKPKSGKFLVLSTDTLIEGVHFPRQTCAKDIAIKSLTVNLSDLAAMGAKPAWFTLAITLTDNINERWIEDFSQQLHKMAADYQLVLIGGDTTKGQILSITIQIHGYVDEHIMLRKNAQIGDIILLSGPIGAAALGLELALNKNTPRLDNLSKKDIQSALDALNKPLPEIEKGLQIAPYCQCAIDISDGLLADLGHILKQSHCGASINLADVPLASCLTPIAYEKSLVMALTGGDDYKLCLTLSKQAWDKFSDEIPQEQQYKFYPIGEIREEKGISFLDNNQQSINKIGHLKLDQLIQGYNHFAN